MHMEQLAFSSTFDKLTDIKEYVGKEIGITKWITIDQDQINTFAKATGDHQWIHTDPQLAKMHSPYGTTIAHGFLVLSLAPRFMYEVYQVQDVIMGLNYGLEKVRFPNATPVDSELRARVRLKDYEDMDEGAKLTMDITFEVKGQEKPSCVAELIALAMTRQIEDI